MIDYCRCDLMRVCKKNGYEISRFSVCPEDKEFDAYDNTCVQRQDSELHFAFLDVIYVPCFPSKSLYNFICFKIFILCSISLKTGSSCAPATIIPSPSTPICVTQTEQCMNQPICDSTDQALLCVKVFSCDIAAARRIFVRSTFPSASKCTCKV